MKDPVELSVIVPTHTDAADLPRCIAALEASDLPRDQWELIVIHDNDARGPAFARNRGIEKSRSGIVAFVDSDVMVHPDALSRMLSHFQSDDVHAVFGSYDNAPSDQGVVSQYRNLLHAYIHQHSSGDVESFWAGCGAVRKSSLIAAGMFDEKRFTRPEIEDVELGYRLRDAGLRILLDPSIQCTHRKRWSLSQMIQSDFARRGVPWTRLLIGRNEFTHPRGLSLGRSERVAVFAALAWLVSLIAALLTWQPVAFAIAAASLVVFIISSASFFSWIAGTRGQSFLVAAIPLHLTYCVVAFSALAWGALTAVVNQSSLERCTRLR